MVSGIGTSLAGMNVATTKIAAHAQNIATQDTDPEIDPVQEIISVKALEMGYKANAAMLETNIELKGTLLDILDND